MIYCVFGHQFFEQKRLDQITQQLESGTLEVEANRELALVSHDSSDVSDFQYFFLLHFTSLAMQTHLSLMC